MTPVDLWRALDDLRGFGVSTWQVVQTAAEMMAASRLIPPGNSLSVLEPARELTMQDWQMLRDRAEVEWRKTEVGASPFLQNVNWTHYPPGFFEVLRRAVVQVFDSSPKAARTGELVELCLSLAEIFTVETPGQSTIAPNVSALAVDILGAHPGDRAYCAFAGSASTALRLARTGAQVDLQVENVVTASFWSALGVAAQVKLRVEEADPYSELLAEWPLSSPSHDLALIVPHLGRKLTLDYPAQTGLGQRTEEAWAMLLAASRAQRRAVCFAPNGFLFRTSLAEQSVKDKAIHRQGLDTVIALPAGSIWRGGGVPGALLVLDPGGPPSDMLMVDLQKDGRGRKELSPAETREVISIVASRKASERARVVSIDSIADNNFNLMPDRYVLTPERESAQRLLSEGTTLALGDLADLYRAQAMPASIDGDSDHGGEVVFEVAVSDLNDVGLPERVAKEVRLSHSEARKVRRAQLEQGDVLLVTKGSVGRVGFVRDLPPDQTWVANQSFVIVRLRKSAPIKDPRVLFRYLASDLAGELFQSLRVGAVIPAFQMADVRQIKVLIPTDDAQGQIAQEVDELFELQSYISTLRGQLVERQHSMWPDNLERAGP